MLQESFGCTGMGTMMSFKIVQYFSSTLKRCINTVCYEYPYVLPIWWFLSSPFLPPSKVLVFHCAIALGIKFIPGYNCNLRYVCP